MQYKSGGSLTRFLLSKKKVQSFSRVQLRGGGGGAAGERRKVRRLVSEAQGLVFLSAGLAGQSQGLVFLSGGLAGQSLGLAGLSVGFAG